MIVTTDTPTEEQLAAVGRFAARAGRNWKELLSSAWTTGKDEGMRDGPYLRQLRNEFGPEWLATFKFPKAKTEFKVSKARFSDGSVMDDTYVYRGVEIQRHNKSRGYSGHWKARVGSNARNNLHFLNAITRTEIIQMIDKHLDAELAS